MSDFAGPSLVEPGVKYVIGESLKQAHTFKMNTYSFFFNLGVVILFFRYSGAFFTTNIRRNRPHKRRTKS